MILTALLAVLPLAAAAPSPTVADPASNAVVSEATDPVRVWYRFDKISSLESIMVSNSDKSRIYGRACGNKLNTGFFADFPITVELESDGGKKITIGGFKASTACIGRNNDEETSFDCAVLDHLVFPETAIIDAAALQAIGDCFPTTSLAVNLKARDAAPTSPKDDIVLNRRQGTNCYPTIITEKVGNGDPHQHFFHKQLSENMNCASASSCSVGSEKTKSYTVGWTASISGGTWITGGFEVMKTWSTGNTYTCNGNKGQKICTWYKVAHTAFKVQNYFYNSCFGTKTKSGDAYLIYAPNKNNKNANGGVYCRTEGNCHFQGDSFWDHSNSRPGGP